MPKFWGYVLGALLALTFGTLGARAAAVTVAPAFAAPSAELTLRGRGFAGNSILDVYFDVRHVAFKATSASGAFVLKINVPASARSGPHVITVLPHSGAGASVQKSFTVRTEWPYWRGSPAAQAYNRTENVITAATVDDLDFAARLAPGKAVVAAPVVTGTNVYFVTTDGHLRAYNRFTLASVFDVAANADPELAVAAGGGLIYLANTNKLYARNAATGALVWQANLPAYVGPPTYAGGVVYVVAQGDASAGLLAFKANCGSAGATCTPLWRGTGANTAGGWIPETSPSVGYGYVYAEMDIKLHRYPVNCATGGATCAPVESVDAITYGPTLAYGYVYYTLWDSGVSKFKLVASVAPDLGQIAWQSEIAGSGDRPLAAARNQVFLAHDVVAFAGPGELLAFGADCGAATCDPLWSAPLESGARPPTVAGDVVFAAGASKFKAFAIHCVNNCPALWQGKAGGGSHLYSAGVVADGTLFAPDPAGLAVFRMPPSAFQQAQRIVPARLRPSPAFAAAEAVLARRLRH